MSDACRALDIPVSAATSASTTSRGGADIDPTPVVGVVGVIEELDTIPPGPRLVDGAR